MKDKQHIPCITRVLDLSETYYLRCSYETQRNIRLLSIALLFTMLASGGVMSFSIATIWAGKTWGFLSFPFVLWLYWQLDTPVIFSDPRKHRSLARAFRVFVALVFSFFNSYLVDSLYFAQDIRAARQAEIRQREDEMRKVFQSNNSFLMQRKIFLQNQIDSIRASLAARKDSLISELNGTGGTRKVGIGPVWRQEYAMYQSDSLSAANVVTSKTGELNTLDSAISANKVAEEEYLSRIPEEVSDGINEKMTLLHRVIFNGTFTNVFTWVLLLLVTLIVELIPFISKYFYDVSEYFEKADIDREVTSKIQELDKEKELKLAAEKVLYNLQAEQLSIGRNYRLDQLHNAMLYYESIIGATQKQIEFLEWTKQQAKAKHRDYYDTHIEPIVKRAAEEIRENSISAMSL